jgi:uncharacterized YccA/Bax inhibitor family protein
MESEPKMASNPAFSAPEFNRPASLSVDELERLYRQPAAADPERADFTPASGQMTYNTVIAKTIISFIVLGLAAGVGWLFPVVALPAAIAGFVLGLVNIFKKQPSPWLVLSYSAVQGLFVGGVSSIFNTMWDGIVAQALFGTTAVVAAVMFLYSNNMIRTSSRMTKIVLGLMVGYLVFSLVNFGLVLFGASESMFGLRGSVEVFGIPLGVVVGVVAVFLAVYSLMLDFDYVRNGVMSRIPELYSWRAAFGITLTVVWLYVEILRLLAIFRSNN